MAVVEIGMRFGTLVVSGLYRTKRSSGSVRRVARCTCDCGAIADVEVYNLTSGNTTRCKACASSSRAAKKKTHGHSYGGDASPLAKKCYYTWQAMKRRCYNPKEQRFGNYGGRGISVCDRWRESYQAFLSDMGLPPTMSHQIDREDNDGNYEPSNCRWVTVETNANNKSNNVVINGMTAADAERQSGVAANTIRARVRRGIPGEMALAGGRVRRRSYVTPGGSFGSIKEAADFYGMSISGMHARFKSEVFPDYHIVQLIG